jgi:hypothetical protein
MDPYDEETETITRLNAMLRLSGAGAYVARFRDQPGIGFWHWYRAHTDEWEECDVFMDCVELEARVGAYIRDRAGR